jgi:hypothetical protein
VRRPELRPHGKDDLLPVAQVRHDLERLGELACCVPRCA